jgi:hypothetical protein
MEEEGENDALQNQMINTVKIDVLAHDGSALPQHRRHLHGRSKASELALQGVVETCAGAQYSGVGIHA